MLFENAISLSHFGVFRKRTGKMLTRLGESRTIFGIFRRRIGKMLARLSESRTGFDVRSRHFSADQCRTKVLTTN
jgi:hypothetical protein